MRYLVLPVIFKVCESISAEPGHGGNSLAELDTWPCRNVAKPASIANDFNDTGGSNRSSIISTNRLNWTAGKPERVARFDFSMANWHAPFVITNCDPAVIVVRLGSNFRLNCHKYNGNRGWKPERKPAVSVMCD